MSAILTPEALARMVPSAFADRPAGGTSSRYQFIPTNEILEALGSEGWLPTKASQARVRNPERQGYQRHAVRLRHRDQAKVAVGDSLVELVLLNSHDRSSAYQLHAGLFRLVCSNGLVIADSLFSKVSIRHAGFSRDQVLEASYRVIDGVGQIAASVEQMRASALSSDQRLTLAERAMRLRWPDRSPVEPQALLEARRHEDRGTDLWRTFNVIQENLMRGGLDGRSTANRRLRTRAVTAISGEVGLNKQLWSLAMECAGAPPATEKAA